MTFRIHSNLRATLALLTVSLCATQASAQVAAPVVQSGPAAVAAPALPIYRSALTGYQPYTDEKVVNWKEANDTTGQIGGWRAYAKEARPNIPAESVADPAASTNPAKP